MVYLTLFFVAFASATLLPLGSEALLLYDISEGYTIGLLWLIASVGNTLGSMVNYWLGLKGESYLENRGYLSRKRWIRLEIHFVSTEDGPCYSHGCRSSEIR